MNVVALLAAGCLLSLSGAGAYASSTEPASPESAVAAEQTHLQQSSSQMRGEATRQGDLPMEFNKPAGPRGHNVINLSF